MKALKVSGYDLITPKMLKKMPEIPQSYRNINDVKAREKFSLLSITSSNNGSNGNYNKPLFIRCGFGQIFSIHSRTFSVVQHVI